MIQETSSYGPRTDTGSHEIKENENCFWTCERLDEKTKSTKMVFSLPDLHLRYCSY
jgi:hypothetical protein